MKNDVVVDLLGVRGSDRVQKKGLTDTNLLVCTNSIPKVRESGNPEDNFLTPTSDVIFG